MELLNLGMRVSLHVKKLGRQAITNPILSHSLWWFVYLTFNLLLSSLEQDFVFPDTLVYKISHFIICVCLLYLHAIFILNRTLSLKKYLICLGATVAMLAAFCLVSYLLDRFLEVLNLRIIIPYFSKPGVYFPASILTGATFILYSFAYWILENFISAERQRSIIELHKERLDKAFLKTELTGLKSQINPHFLYNTLNFFYAQSIHYSKNLSKGIMLLSEMMRYALKDDDSEGKVALEKEVQHIYNFIEINQLRFNNRLQVFFEINGNLRYRRIMPLVLITFVENAFKYGELNDPDNPLIIRLTLFENQLNFKTHNLKCKSSYEKSEGIGLTNTRRRLALGYPNNHTLTIKELGDFYEVELALVL